MKNVYKMAAYLTLLAIALFMQGCCFKCVTISVPNLPTGKEWPPKAWGDPRDAIKANTSCAITTCNATFPEKCSEVVPIPCPRGSTL